MKAVGQASEVLRPRGAPASQAALRALMRDAVISAGLGFVVLGQALTMVQVAGIALVIIALIGATLR